MILSVVGTTWSRLRAGRETAAKFQAKLDQHGAQLEAIVGAVKASSAEVAALPGGSTERAEDAAKEKAGV